MPVAAIFSYSSSWMIVTDETHTLDCHWCVFYVASDQLDSQARLHKVHELRHKSNKEHTFNRMNLALDQPWELRNTDDNDDIMTYTTCSKNKMYAC